MVSHWHSLAQLYLWLTWLYLYTDLTGISFQLKRIKKVGWSIWSLRVVTRVPLGVSSLCACVFFFNQSYLSLALWLLMPMFCWMGLECIACYYGCKCPPEPVMNTVTETFSTAKEQAARPELHHITVSLIHHDWFCSIPFTIKSFNYFHYKLLRLNSKLFFWSFFFPVFVSFHQSFRFAWCIPALFLSVSES